MAKLPSVTVTSLLSHVRGGTSLSGAQPGTGTVSLGARLLSQAMPSRSRSRSPRWPS
jgi:hypothetical protein